MIKEYPTKHAEYSVILQERERQRIAKEYSVSNKPAGRVGGGVRSLLFNVSDVCMCVCVANAANAAAEPTEGGGQQGSRVH